jgi:hypothetical protein
MARVLIVFLPSNTVATASQVRMTGVSLAVLYERVSGKEGSVRSTLGAIIDSVPLYEAAGCHLYQFSFSPL